MKNIFYYQTCIGRIGIADNGEAITNLFFFRGKGMIDDNVKQYKCIQQDLGANKASDLGANQVSNVPQSSDALRNAIDSGYAAVSQDLDIQQAAKNHNTAIVKETAITGKAAEQLNEYLAGRRKEFDIPLSPEGTEFQQAVWKALMEIPYGATRSYGQIAKSIGKPRACRAVGMANNRNPIAILIPCHRVIGSCGKLTGYAGGLDIKEKLLDIERQKA